MRRLYLQIYLAHVAILVLSLAGLSAWWWWASDSEPWGFRAASVVATELLPGVDRPSEEVRERVTVLAERLGLDLELHAADGELLARAGTPLPARDVREPDSEWDHRPGPHRVANLELPDGRRLLFRSRREPRHGAGGFAVAVGVLAVAVGIGAWPLARRLTRRIERLRGRVEQLGSGDLGTRVPVEGRDEVADLARSFNGAAERIQALVDSQRRMLAHASHELRSPLARLRVAAELLAESPRPDLREQVSRDIAELDDLIGEILLSSRLDAPEGLDRREDLDFREIVASEAARWEVPVLGEPAPVRLVGDPRLLRRLVRNLCENALRHAGGTDVEARVDIGPRGSARLRVSDRGPGVPDSEQERIFDPFYRPEGAREGADGGYGLGLALVRQIARHHGGEARCLGRPGGGCCFEVTLA